MSYESLHSPSSVENSAELKDNDYLEKRRKNNSSARRSREVRRMRELTARKRMEELEEENRQLHEEISHLRLEYSQLLIMFLARNSSTATDSQ